MEEDNKKRSDRVKEIEKEVEKFASGTEKELSFAPVEKEWRAIQWVLSSWLPQFPTLWIFKFIFSTFHMYSMLTQQSIQSIKEWYEHVCILSAPSQARDSRDSWSDISELLQRSEHGETRGFV